MPFLHDNCCYIFDVCMEITASKYVVKALVFGSHKNSIIKSAPEKRIAKTFLSSPEFNNRPPASSAAPEVLTLVEAGEESVGGGGDSSRGPRSGGASRLGRPENALEVALAIPSRVGPGSRWTWRSFCPARRWRC